MVSVHWEQIMKIELTKGKKVIIDDEDYILISRYKWHTLKTNVNYYAATNIGGRKNRKYILMHRLIMHANDERDVDHINYNGLDNRKINLRLCSRKNNIRRKNKCIKPCSSQYKGVWWRKDTKKWAAEITVDGKKIALGCFMNEIEAAQAYNHAATEYFGEFKRLNIIEDYT